MLSKSYIKTVVKRYLRSLPIKSEFVILFGSSISENRLRNSDIDLIVVSDDFKKMSFHERLFLLQKHWKHDIDLEALGYTVEEFNRLKEKSIVIQEAVEKGEMIK